MPYAEVLYNSNTYMSDEIKTTPEVVAEEVVAEGAPEVVATEEVVAKDAEAAA